MKLDRRLLHRARAARVDLILAIGLGLLAGILLVWQALFLSRITSGVFLEHKSLRDVRAALLVLLLLAIVRAAASWGGEVAASRVARRVKTDLRQELSTRLLSLGPAYASGERTGELTNTVVEGVEALDAYFSQYVPQLALAALVPLTILICVFPIDWLSGLIFLLTAPLIPIFVILIGHLADRLTRRQWTSLSRMSAHFLDVLQGLTTLKLLGRSREQTRAIARISARYRGTTLGVLRVAFLSALVMEMVATLSTAVVAVGIGLRLLYARMGFAEAFFILLLAPEFYLPLRLLGVRFHAGMSGVAAAERIFQVLDVAQTRVKGPAESYSNPNLDLELDIRFTEVHYAYDGGERPALNGLSFRIPPGKRAALVGPSGAGKSTVAHLLLRFIEPDRGVITVGGRALSDLHPQAWRSLIGWVPQNPYLFHATVAENIRLARPEATHNEVIQAAQRAHAHTFIQSLPQGYATLVGERGARLSAGQGQRIALARAFLRDAPLLIFDEVTSNLDPMHEKLLRQTLEHLMHGRTVLIIAHRLGTVYRADHILVIAGGRLVESGTHAALLERGELYRQLVTAHTWSRESYLRAGSGSSLGRGGLA